MFHKNFLRNGIVGRIGVMEIKVQEVMIDPKIPDFIKQALCVLNKGIHTFTCMITSSLQEIDDIQPI